MPASCLRQEAVDSAEKWKQFAEGLQAKQAEAGEALAALQAELQVGAGCWPAPRGLGWLCAALREKL